MTATAFRITPPHRRDLLLTLWLALLGADRLDLFGGATTFSLTPFLALTPVLVVRLLVGRLRVPTALAIPRPALKYVALVCALVVVAGLSVFVSPDPSLSAQRTFLLAVQIVGSLVVVLLRPDLRADPERMLPGVNAKMLKQVNSDPKRLKHAEAIVLSMTPEERKNPEIMNGSRRARVAKGAGRSISDVNRLLEQFREMQKMMKKAAQGGGGRVPPGMFGRYR